MKKRFLTFVAALALLATAHGAHALTAQQEKMKSCNADATAKGLNGDARKQFMSGCLKDGAGAAALTPQQEKMKSCNADATAKGLKGDARKAFMSSCLSK